LRRHPLSLFMGSHAKARSDPRGVAIELPENEFLVFSMAQ